MDITRTDWENVIKESLKQFALMEKTTKEMKLAKEVQDIILKYAEEQLKKFPEPPKAPDVPDEKPAGVE